MSDFTAGAIIGWLLAGLGVVFILLGADGAINMALGCGIVAVILTLGAIHEHFEDKRYRH